jgi:hypothetical protein
MQVESTQSSIAGRLRFPLLTAPTEEQPVGVWAQRRRKYLRERKEPIFSALLLSGSPIAGSLEVSLYRLENFLSEGNFLL